MSASISLINGLPCDSPRRSGENRDWSAGLADFYNCHVSGADRHTAPERRAEMDLNGYCTYDDEGVKARPVTVVENGVLKTFLMSRSPVQGVDHSNGHGRRQPGLEVAITCALVAEA